MNETRRVLAIGYSQSGQLTAVLDSILGPLRDSDRVEVTMLPLQPIEPFPFPWPFWRFFDTFPETVHEIPAPIEEPVADAGIDAEFDLVILAYQVWFLSPSMPVTAFLQSPQARKLLAGRPVITVVGCRNMWLMAQETVKTRLADLGADLVDNVVLTDRAHSAATFVSTPLWMLTGRRGPFLGGLIPAAGIPAADIRDAARFGEAIARQLPARTNGDRSPMLRGLGAVRINERLIASERIAHRSFRLWGALLRSLGEPGTPVRRCVLVLYVVFLLTMIVTVVPASAVIKRLLAPLTRQRTARQRAYYAAPSGESAEPRDQVA